MLNKLLISILLSSSLLATIINVPGDLTTIQAGIDSSSSGDTVLVQPGTYIENITFNGENIVVGSLFIITHDTLYISSTVIDGNQNGPVVTFDNGESNACILEGFTVTNGLGDQHGAGGVFINSGNPIISNLTIVGNNGGDQGGGLTFIGSDALVINCRVIGNYSGTKGGGFRLLSESNPIIESCIIGENNAHAGGGAVYCSNNSNPIIRNSLIINNESEQGGGIECSNSNPIIINSTITENIAVNYGGCIRAHNYSTPLIVNSILWNNSPHEIYQDGDSDVTIQFSNIKGGFTGNGNIDSDPLFMNSEDGLFQLNQYSPCIGVGSDSVQIDGTWYYAPETDILDNPRPNPVGSNPDIGAYENPLSGPLHNTLIHVAVTGNDSGSTGLESAPFEHIQTAINWAWNGDTILIHPGTYVENINYNNKNIVVGSFFLTTNDTSYISTTIIDGDQSGSVVIIGSEATIIGLTIQNGRAYNSGGISCTGNSQLQSLMIRSCSAHNDGEAMYINSPITISGCKFISNGDYVHDGSTIYADHGFNISNSIFINNIGVEDIWTHQGDITFHDVKMISSDDDQMNSLWIGDNVNILAYNSLFVSDVAPITGYSEDDIFINCTIVNHSAHETNNIDPPIIWGFNNIVYADSVNFISESSNNYQLTDYSQFVGAGIDSMEIIDTWYYSPTADITGNPRPNPIDSNPDIGAFESELTEPIDAIESIHPEQNELDVSNSTSISVVFTNDIDPSTIQIGTFIVFGSQTGLHCGTYNYNSGIQTVTFTPDIEFSPGELVSIILTSGIKDVYHQAIPPVQWSFMVKSFGGSAQFHNRTNYNVPETPQSVVPSDLDNDGDIDLAMIASTWRKMSVLYNDGEGTFSNRTDYNTGINPRALETSDLNLDGNMDIIVANGSDNNVSIYLNNGDGTFLDSANYKFTTGLDPSSIASSDFDGDGDFDIAVTNDWESANSFSILLNNGDGTFGPRTDYHAGNIPRYAQSADFDQDWDMDIAIPIQNSIGVFSNDGDGGFHNRFDYNYGDGPGDLSYCDVDADGDIDLITCNSVDFTILSIINNGDGTFTSSNSVETNDILTSIISIDFDGDGDMDVAGVDQYADSLIVLINDGLGNYNLLSRYGHGDRPVRITSADLDGDGDMDIIIANHNSDDLSILFNINCFQADIHVLNQEEYTDSVELYFDIINPDSNFVSLLCEYSPNSGDTWHPASVSGNTSNIDPEEYNNNSVYWLSNLDLPNLDINNVYIKITPFDQYSVGRSDSIGPIHIDNNFPPSISIVPLLSEQQADILIHYDLFDHEHDSLGILCEYYNRAADTWETASLEGDTNGITNYTGSINWKSIADLPYANGEQLYKITPYDNDIGIADSIIVDIDQLGLPVATGISDFTLEMSEDISVSYIIEDDENDTLDLIIEYSTDCGANWYDAAVSGDYLNLDTSMYSSSFVWHSAMDLPGIDKSSIKLLITPVDQNIGIGIESNAFHVDNNIPPSFDYISCPDSMIVRANLEFYITDMEADTITIGIDYSVNQGFSWTSCLNTDDLTNIMPSEYHSIIEWLTYKSFGFNRLRDVWIRFTAYDNDPGTDTTIKNITILNYPAEFTGDLEVTPDDLAIFAAAWNSTPQNTTYDIGPAHGIVPELIPVQDGILNFEDLAVFIQMWNWSFNNSGINPVSLHTRESNQLIAYSVFKPSEIRTSEGITSICFNSSSNDLLQFELLANHDVDGLSLTYEKGGYFINRYKSSPSLTKFKKDQGRELYCITGLESIKEGSNSGDIVTVSVLNKSFSIIPLELHYRAWNTKGELVENGQFDISIESCLPDQFSLHQNYPNPFNHITTINYDLPGDGQVKLNIYDISGRTVTKLINEEQQAGYKSVQWNGKNSSGQEVSTGMYFYSIEALKYFAIKKMILIK